MKMKELKLKNLELESFHGFILNLKLKGKQNRHRMRIIKELELAMDAFKKDLKTLVEEFSLKDENGEPVVIQEERDGKPFVTYDIEDPQQFAHERTLLAEEEFTLDGNKFNEELQTLLVAMDESETELSGNEAVVEQLIYERIENAI